MLHDEKWKIFQLMNFPVLRHRQRDRNHIYFVLLLLLLSVLFEIKNRIRLLIRTTFDTDIVLCLIKSLNEITSNILLFFSFLSYFPNECWSHTITKKTSKAIYNLLILWVITQTTCISTSLLLYIYICL